MRFGDVGYAWDLVGPISSGNMMPDKGIYVISGNQLGFEKFTFWPMDSLVNKPSIFHYVVFYI